MKFSIPIKLPSLANLRISWRQMARLKKKQREATAIAIWLSRSRDQEIMPSPPLVVTITRIGPRKLDDDNLAISCKYVRDEVANIVGVNDGSSLYTWKYEQRIGPYAVEVEIIRR